MSNNIYGGVVYPHSSFEFDHVYHNYKEAIDDVNNNNVLIGRFVFIAYSPKELDQQTRNSVEHFALFNGTKPNGYDDSGDQQAYATNCQIDYDYYKKQGKEYFSWDRHVLRKIYRPGIEGKEGTFEYEDIVQLGTSISLNGLKIQDVNGQDNILSIDENKHLNTTLSINYNSTDQTIELWGNSKDKPFSSFDASAFVRDSFLSDVKYNDNTDELVFTFITIDQATGEQMEQVLSVPVTITVDMLDAGDGIEIIGNDIGVKLNGDQNEYQYLDSNKTYLQVDQNGLVLKGINDTFQYLENILKNKVMFFVSTESDFDVNSIFTKDGHNNGDIGIIYSKIPGENSTANYCNTYVWDSDTDTWRALNGNYNAENIYFDENLIFTTNVGYAQIDSATGRTVVDTQGKNLKQIFNELFQRATNPEIIQPSLSIKIKVNGTTITTNTKYEVGKTISVAYEIGFEDGNYQFGPSTGVTIIEGSVEDSRGNSNSNLSNSYFDNISILDNNSYSITATALHSDGDIPKNNLDQEWLDGRIRSNTIEVTSPIIGSYRAYFYGTTTKSVKDLKSADIQGMNNGGEYNSKKTITIKANGQEGLKAFIVAIPDTNTRNGVTQVKSTAGMTVDVTAQWQKPVTDFNVSVNDYSGNNPVAYKIYAWEPSLIDPGTIHEITLG